EVMRCEPDLAELAPPQFSHVVRHCLAKDATLRWQDASDVRLELEWAGNSQAAPLQRLERRWVAFAAGLVVSGAALSLFWRGPHSVERSLVRLAVDPGPNVVEGLSTTMSTTIAVSPDGNRLVFVARTPDGTRRLATRLLNQQKLAVLDGTE